MSAGDIDDKQGPAGYLERLRTLNKDLDNYLRAAPDLPIERVQIPFGAGISEDGQTRYVDNRLNAELNGIDVSPALATHESTEWALRQFANVGKNYATDSEGHHLANRAEADWVEQNGLDLKAYNNFIDPQIRKLEKLPLTNVPKDLALYPYEGTDLLEKIKSAQKGLSSSGSRTSDSQSENAGSQPAGPTKLQAQ